MRFSNADGRRVAEIEIPGASPRRIEHEGPGCSSLAEATVALLSVLLDEMTTAPPPPPAETPPRPPAEPARSVVRVEAGAVFSQGLVASLAAGAMVGASLRPLPWASFGVAAEGWPARDHAIAISSASAIERAVSLPISFGMYSLSAPTTITRPVCWRPPRPSTR